MMGKCKLLVLEAILFQVYNGRTKHYKVQE